MSMTDEPRTEVGKLLLMAGLTFHSGRRLADKPGVIAAIEDEARVQLLAELRQKVGALPKWDKRSVPGGFHVNRAAVLALLDSPESAT